MSRMSDWLSDNLGSSSDWHNYWGNRYPNTGINYNDQNWASVVADALAAGTGAFAETGAHLANDLTGNREGDPMGWGAIADWGKATRERNTHDYLPGSGRYYMSTIAQALPEMGVDMAASMGAGAAAGLALGPQAAAAAGAAKTLATAVKWGKRALDFYNSEKKLAKAARFLTPAAENLPAWAAATTTGMGLEGAFEGQRAMDDYIEEAKRNGTYVPGVTEEEGRNLRWNVFKDNQILLGGTNALENALIFGKGKGLFNALKRLGVASGIEGFEEGAQQIFPKAEQGKNWSVTDRDVLESAAIGALMGGGMHLAGRGIRHAFPNAFGDSYDTDTTNPMTDPNRTAERDSDVPLPGNIDYTEADPSDIVNDWLNQQAGFGNMGVDADVDIPQTQQSQQAPTGNVDLSDIPQQDFEDKGLAKTNNALKGKFRQLYDWAVQSFGKKVEISGGARSPEHNKEVNGSEHSHHLSGNALDVNVSMLSDAERDAFIQKAKEMGFNADGDDFYHDKGSGYHAHLVYKDDGSASQPATGGQREGHANAWAITDVFRKAGYNDEAIAGILGRVQQEHNFETSDVEEHWDTDANGEKVWVGGYGMFQWNGGRTTAFLDWAKQNGKDPQNPTTQAEYALIEAQQKGLTPEKMNQLSAEQAADLWTEKWEVGRPGSERQYAGEWRDRLKNGGGSTGSISTQDFGKILGNHMIDFAGSEDDNITNSYQRIMDSLDDGAKSVLANRFANMFSADGGFNNTAENRQALAQDDYVAAFIQRFAEANAPQVAAPMIKNGRISKQAVKDYFTPHIAGVNMHFLKDAIAKDKLSDTEKVAVLQEAGNQLNVPRLNKSEAEQIKFVNDLQSAIDSRDFKKIYSLMPQATAQAIASTRQPEPTAQPAAAVITPEQSEAPIQEQPPAPAAQPQGVQPALPATSNQETVQPAPQYAPETVQNAPQPVQATPAPQALPSVPTEQENAQTAAQVANKAQQIANVQGQQFDFDSRLAELQAMPLGQLEQLGQQTLANMQTAGVPVNESLANDLAAGKENAIAHAESKMAEAGVANNATTTSPTGSNQEQVQSNVASQVTNEPTSDKESKTIKQFREKADKVIEQYRDDKITYQEAFGKLEEMYVKADNAAKTKDERNVAAQTFLSAGEALERARQEKESHPQKLDYANMSLDELKAERQRLIDEEVERMNRNPGGKGTNNGYTYNDRGEITGRYGESLNPQWYQDAYAELGRAPRKKEYPGIALKNLQKHQQFAELEDAIAQTEKESAKNEPVATNEETSKVEPAEQEVTENAKSNEEVALEVNKADTIASEIKGITFTYGEKSQENQYETVYTVNMDKVPSKEAANKLMEGTHGRWDGRRTMKFNSKESAEKFLSHVKDTYGATAIRQEDKYNGFLKDMSPLQQGRADKALSKLENYNGKIAPRAKIVEDLVANGGHAEIKGKEYRLYKDNGAYVNLTKAEYDYAKYLEGMQDDKAVDGAMPETDNAFGMSADDAFADFANLAGITPVQQEKAEPKAKSTTKAKPKKKKRNMGLSDTSKEREEELKKQLSEALKKSRNRLNSTPVIFDPDVIVPAFNLGRLYVQRGAENFAEYARDMIDAVGDSVRGWLRPVWEMIENYPEGKSIDESLVIPAFRYVGSFMHNKPQATYEDVRADFVKRAGEDTAAKFDDLLKVAYSGAYRCYNDNAEVTDNELNDSAGENLERDSEGNNQDGLGSVHGDGESVSRGGQGVQQTGKDSRSQRSGSVHGRGTARSGETSDSGVQGSESERGNRDDSAGGKQLTGSRRDSYDGQAVDDSRNADSFGTAKNRPVNDGNRGNKAETVNKDTFKAGNREQIASSMPFLMKEQVDDVVKADTRLYANNGEGMMFTNGTGTGKTFTGLGCIKRAVQQGKKNILIIAPTDKVQNDWITTGKGFFGLDISKLENTTDAGEGIVITSYENVGANNKLVKRDWDMIVTDESHKLMQGEKGNRTKALENVRAMTYHVDGLRERFERLHAKEYDRLAELRGKASDKEHPITAAEKQELESLQSKLIKEQEKAVAEWKGIRQEDKPKVLFLSATPFSYVPDIDYAEGYLFHYDRKKNQNGGYNQPDAYGDFLIKHFGYRMRVGKLTKPDADVNNDLMEIQFNQWLKDQGVLSGRKLKVTPDYERGYLLVDGGVGKQIDEGMKIATERGVSDSDQKYGKLHGLFENKLKGNKTRYLLEAIKAKEAVSIINEYVKAGKKVVIFHDFKKNEAENPFVLTDEDFEYMDEVDRNTARQQYARFCKDHPELLNLNLDDLQSPIERFTAEFGDSMRIFNGDIPKKKRETAVREFQDDDSRVNIILCQRASAKEGISMHDTTGKHQRVLIDLGLATRPTDLIQGEGRIYRTGVITDAIIRYLNTGTDMEKRAFASTIAGRASTAENLSMGEEARALRNAIVEGFMESLDGDSWKKYLPGSKTEGKGGKARDSKLMDGVSPYEAAKSDYFANQKKTSKNKAQEGIDYFPTPEPIGFKMVEWLGLKPGDRALEPSAGHGAISRYFGAETRNTIVEPSPELATLAKMRLNGGTTAKVVEGRFEDLDIHNKYEGIVMNPPYGVGGKTAYEHVAKAFDHLADGGRLIAIVPDGAAANKRLENWLYGDGTKANPGQSNAAILTEIKLPQVTFNRAGTSVATKILIIDKYNDPADFAEMERRQIEEGIDTLDLTGVNDINELFDKLEYVRTPERVGADIPRHFTNSVNKKGNPSRKYITLPDDTKLLDNNKLCELASNFRGARDMRGGWYEFFNENDRAKFVKAANKYLAGQETLATEQQEIVDEVLNQPEGTTEHFEGGDFKDTNGRVNPQAKIKGNMPRKVYDPVKSLAQRHGGRYKKEARGFVFDSAEERSAFLKEAEAFLGNHKYSVAWVGSPADFDKFDLGYVGTGEGAQAHGYGLYSAANRVVAQGYRDKLSEFTNPKVSINGTEYERTEDIDGDIIYTKNGEPLPWGTDDIDAQVVDYFIFNNFNKKHTKEAIEKQIQEFEKGGKQYEGSIENARKIIERLNSADIKKISGGASGKLYQVEIPDIDVLLDEQKSFNEQPEKVQNALRKLISESETAKKHPAFAEQIYEANGKKIYGIVVGLAEGDAPKNANFNNTQKLGSELLNKYGIKGITYVGGLDDRCFVIFDDKAIKILNKFSARNKNLEMLSNITFTPDSKLTEREKELQRMGERMGVPVVFFEGDKSINGFHSRGISFINRKAGMSASWTFWHEAFHWIKKNNPDLFKSLMNHLKTKAPFSKEQLDAYRASIGEPTMKDNDVIEEMMADAMPEIRKRMPFLKELAAENKSLYQRFVAWIREAMDTLRDLFHANPNGLSTEQVDLMHEKFADLVRDIHGLHNEAIIKVASTSDRTFTLPNGEPLVSYSRNGEKSLDNSDNLGDNVGEEVGQQRLADKYSPEATQAIQSRLEGLADKAKASFKPDDTPAVKREKILHDFVENRNTALDDYLRTKDGVTYDLLVDWQMVLDYSRELIANDASGMDRLGIQGNRSKNPGGASAIHDEAKPQKQPGNTAQSNQEELENTDAGRINWKVPHEYDTHDNDKLIKFIRNSGYAKHSDNQGALPILPDERVRKPYEYDGKYRVTVNTARLTDDQINNLHTLAANNSSVKVLQGAEKETLNFVFGNNQHGERFRNEVIAYFNTDDVSLSATPNLPGSFERIKNATRKLLGLQEKLEDNVQDRHTAKINKRNSLDDSLDWNWWMHTMQYLAGKNEAIKRMYYLGKRCMDEQEHLRNEFTEVVIKINKLVADPKERRDLWALLWAGDAEKKEYTTEELREAGFSDNVITAYRLVRDNLAKAYKLVNEARMQVKVRNKTMKASELPEFMKEHFIDNGDIINTQDIGGGKIVLTYRGAKVYEGLSKTVDDELLKQYEADDNIVITDKKQLGEGVYEVTYNERPKPMAKLEGYMPHFFHRFMVYESRKDEAGNEIKVSVGSAESLADATKIANEIAKKNPDKEFFIDTHGFTNGDENNGVVIGDLNFESMTKQLAENTKMSLKEANKFLHDNAGATLKNRHRFFGNMMKRTGAEGFDKNMMWALEHYFNSAARYVAMEHFKPDAISWYERFFGDFNADPETIKGENKRNTARICRQYIMDVNGNPRWLEEQLNKIIDHTPVLGQWLNDTYNGRPALAISSNMSGAMAVTKLGLLNVSSAMLNFMQFINIVTMLDSAKYAKMGLDKALNPSELDQLILDRSGVMDEINLASDAGGYTQTRDYGGVRKGWAKVKWAANKSMFLFNKADALMRKAAVLGAYYQGVQEKGMKPDNGQTISAEALEYAREVNSEANFDYSAANTPAMIRAGSVVTQQLFQFQKYPIMEYEFVKKHVVNGTNSQRVKFLMPYFLLTGLPGMIPFGELLNAFISMFVPGDDDDFAKKMKAELMRWAGNDSAKQAVVNSLTNGPLAAFTGIDISERAGMQNFFAGRYFGNEKPESAWDAVGHALGGATYSTVSGVQKQIHNGNPIEAIKAISPSLGNFAQAVVGETRTTHHRVGSTYDGMYERILHGMGFRHIDETNTQFINSYLYESKKRQQEDKKFIMDAYLDDPSEENREQLVFWGITDKQLKQYSEGREKSSRDRAAGEEKKKSKKPKTEAQIRDDELREFVK